MFRRTFLAGLVSSVLGSANPNDADRDRQSTSNNPMTLTLRIEHTDGTESSLSAVVPDAFGDSNAPSLSTLRIEQAIARQPDATDSAEITVYRDSWADVEGDIDGLNDTFYIEEDGTDIFGGRLADAEVQGAVVSILLDDPKRDALDDERSAPNVLYGVASDTDHLEDNILPRIQTVTAGTLETQVEEIEFSEANAPPGLSIAELARTTGAEVLYQPDFSVDYVSRLGTDRTGETLSGPNGTLISEPRVETRERKHVTHVRVLGSQSGTAQVIAEGTIDSFDPETDRRVYYDHPDKRIQTQSYAEELRDQFLDEFDGAREAVDVEGDIAPWVEPSLGDTFHVSLPDDNVDDDLRIVELRRILDAGGERYRAVLSNRKLTRERSADRNARSVAEFETANPGQVVRDSVNVGFDPVDVGDPMTFTIDYPENVIEEYLVQLRIESQPYRGRVISLGHTHEVTIDGHTHEVTLDDHVHSVSISGHTHAYTYSATPHLHVLDNVGLFETGSTEEAEGHTHSFHISNTILEDEEEGETTSSGGGTETTTGGGGGTTETTSSGGGTTETTDEQGDLGPGVNEFPDEQVSNVSISIGDTTVASGLNPDPELKETFDVEGIFEGGENQITVETESLGEVRVSITYEVRKNAGDV